MWKENSFNYVENNSFLLDLVQEYFSEYNIILLIEVRDDYWKGLLILQNNDFESFWKREVQLFICV